MGTTIETEGQPLRRFLKEEELGDRKVDELIGLCMGLISDNAISQKEAEFLLTWLRNNADLADQWPVSILYSRIEEMLVDRDLEADEKEELLELLQEMTGTLPAEQSESPVPLDEPPTGNSFDGRRFFLSGRFVVGRKACCDAVTARKGVVDSSLGESTDYVILGTLKTSDPKESDATLARATELRASGCGLRIITEEQWVRSFRRLV